jgi:hypothetical protein
LFWSLAVVIRFSFSKSLSGLFADLCSFYHPADQRSCRDTEREYCRNGQRKMLVQPMTGVIQQFFGSITDLLSGASHCSYAIPNRVSNRSGCASTDSAM